MKTKIIKDMGCCGCRFAIYGEKCYFYKHKKEYKVGIIEHIDTLPERYNWKDLVKVPECYQSEGRWTFVLRGKK